MSHNDDIIAESCRNGVRFESIGTHLEKVGRINWSAAEEEYQYIDLTSVDRTTGRIAGTTLVDSSTAPSRAQQVVKEGDVLFGTTRPTLLRYTSITAEYDGQIASTGYCVLRPKNDSLETRFLFHLLGTTRFLAYVEANQAGASYPAISDSLVKKFRIPVPPLEVQREIVRILDTFTALEAELEAELEARRIQFEHYRNSLLSFDDEMRWMPLGEVLQNFDSQRRPVTRSSRRPGPFPYYGANGVQDLVHDYIFEGTFLLIGEDGSVTTADGSPVLNWAAGKIWVNNHAHIMTTKSDSFDLRFAYHFLSTVDVRPFVTGGTQPKLNQGNLNKIPLPLPSIAEQRRIVSILDNFDALTNDLSIGLPAEIAARRKQYEYYRDKLLTFKELQP